MMDLRHVAERARRAGHREARSTEATRPDRGPERGDVQTVSAIGRDEAFLSDVDVTLSRPALPELRALDEFTPRAGDTGQVVR